MVLNGEDEGILGHVEGVRLDGILKLFKKSFYSYQGAVAFDKIKCILMSFGSYEISFKSQLS
jgi:hypothetical protein